VRVGQADINNLLVEFALLLYPKGGHLSTLKYLKTHELKIQKNLIADKHGQSNQKRLREMKGRKRKGGFSPPSIQPRLALEIQAY